MTAPCTETDIEGTSSPIGKGITLSSRGEVTRWRLVRIGLATLTVLGAGCTSAWGQQPDATGKFVPAGWTVEEEIKGDLNGDAVPDAVLMLVQQGHAGPTDEAGRMLVVLAGATSQSTNYLTGKRITESLRYDRAKDKDVVVGKKTSSVATTPVFLEDVDAGPL